MTPDQAQRKAEFDRLFESLPGTNVQRIASVCQAIAVKTGTVRIWRLKAPPRVPSQRSIDLLKQALSKPRR
ncbi:MAG: hypothetical protein LW712_11175 [Burkholderiaceae bacterium]|jgi:hypothetical protein|nr:hypothetical protein [Burkholderiaceae bacterium]